MTDKHKDIIGKIFFFSRGDTFIKVVSVEGKIDPIIKTGLMMTILDLQNNEKSSCHFVEEISEEYHHLPPNYPQSKIDTYFMETARRNEANEILHDLAMEILLHE